MWREPPYADKLYASLGGADLDDSYPSKVAKTTREREQEARKAKLDHVQEQVASGELVIRKMTAAEKAKWAKQRRALDAGSTPTERARRAAALENRRKRSERFD